MSAHVRSIRLPRDPHHEFVRVMAHATVEKRTEDYDEARARYLARGASRFEAETKAARVIRPYEVLVGAYNAMVDNGIDMALLLLVGGAGTAFNNANARLGVAATDRRGRERQMLTELATYLGRAVEVRDIDSNKCYVVSLSRALHPHVPLDFISIVEEHHLYTYPATGAAWPKVPPNYMGFRYGGQLQYVCHVDDHAITTNKSEFFPGTPSVEHAADFILTLGPFIRPSVRVPAGPNVLRNSRVWADIDLLLTAESITDAVRLTKKRRKDDGPLATASK